MDKQVTIIESQEVGDCPPGRYELTIEHIIDAWLDAKMNRSGSEKTRRAYTDTLHQFRSLLLTTGLDLFSEQVSVLALAMQGYAGRGAAGYEVSSSTYNQKLAILSSFYSYAIKHGTTKENPVILVERRTVATKHAALPLSTSIVKSGLSSIDRTARGPA